MDYITYYKRLQHIVMLARKQNTGTPKELADRYYISERTVKRMVNTLKQQGVNIQYNRNSKTYIII
jgi:predicted DNA-binding transcriptional regulator YafY